jgi:SAM-dependent methyltransferase
MYDAKEYWEKRLASGFDISRTGCLGYGRKYNEWIYRACKRNLDLVRKKHHIEVKGKSILDIGCGSGYFIKYFSDLGAGSITGIDISPTSISKLYSVYPSYKFVEGDIASDVLSLDGLDHTFDLVVAFAVLYHIVSEEGFDIAIQNIRKLAKVGAYVLISDNFLRRYQPYVPGLHQFSRTYGRYEDALNLNGIHVIDLVPIYYFLNAPVDINNPKLLWLAQTPWSLLHSVRNESYLNIVGAILYAVDVVALRFVKNSITSELLVCKVAK